MIGGLVACGFVGICVCAGLAWAYDRDPEGRDR